MRGIDFTSWSSILAGLAGLMLVTLIGMGMRLVMMLTVQQRRERVNRQINERLRTLIAAYKTLGGSFTGDLAVDPRHLREIRRAGDARDETARAEPAKTETIDPSREDERTADAPHSDRRRRTRDAVEAALADIILLGTEDQVRLAERAARELIAGRPVHVHDLVISLRDFIRKALDLDPIPADLAIPHQGPIRPTGSGGAKGKGESGRSEGGGRGGAGGMGMGAGAGLGAGVALGQVHQSDQDRDG